MNNKLRLHARYASLMVIILAGILLASCGTLEVGVEITPTPEPTPEPGPFTYNNEGYGFSFTYPNGWELSEAPNLVTLKHGSLRLEIGYRRLDEVIDLQARTGMPAGDFIYINKIFFQDQVIPVESLQYEKKDKMLVFNSTRPVTAGNLMFHFVVEDLESNYEEIDIPVELQEQAIAIVESVQLGEAALIPLPTPDQGDSADEGKYTNPAYGFSFEYPPSWTLRDEGHQVTLSRDTYELHFTYRQLEESVDIQPYRTGLPAGQLVTMSGIEAAGHELRRDVLLYEDQVKMVLYQFQGIPEIPVNDRVVMTILLEDTQSDYAALEIPQEVQDEADQIVASLSGFEPSTVQYDGSAIGWYGSVRSNDREPPYEYILDLLPENAGSVGLMPTSEFLNDLIGSLADKEPPSEKAHFWGTVDCDTPEGELCVLLVGQIRPDGPGDLFPPDPVTGWRGAIVSAPEMAQVDDMFILADRFPVQYGIQAKLDQDYTPGLESQIEKLRDSGTIVRIWGEVTCGVVDANGCQILVERIEVE